MGCKVAISPHHFVLYNMLNAHLRDGMDPLSRSFFSLSNSLSLSLSSHLVISPKFPSL